MAMDGLRRIVVAGGVRLEQHGVLVSKVQARAGPTHSLVDVLAAAVRVLPAGPRIALLGFGGGGVLAPLRAMGVSQEIEAVDVSRAAYRLFRRICASWSGPVRWQQAEAGAWLAARRGPYDLILEDLSIPVCGEIVKPPSIWAGLPGLMRARLTKEGVAVFNLLRPTSETWEKAVGRVAGPFRFALSVTLRHYENRLVLACDAPWSARMVSRRMHAALRRIHSRLAGQFTVRTVAMRGSRACGDRP